MYKDAISEIRFRTPALSMTLPKTIATSDGSFTKLLIISKLEVAFLLLMHGQS
jgi:hypothetical protein